MKNLITLLALLLSSSIGFAQTIFQGEYTIGTSGDADYETISLAVEDLVGGVVNGPTVFKIEPGFYEEKVLLTSVTGASETNTVTFTSATSDAKSVTIFSDTATTFKLFEVSFIRLTHLTIQNTGTNYQSRALSIESNENPASEFIIVENCIIKADTQSSTPEIYGMYVITFAEPGNGNIIIRNNTVIGGYTGIYLYSGSFTYGINNIVKANTVLDAYDKGIDVRYQISATVDGNYIRMRKTDVPREFAVGLYSNGPYNCLFKNNMIVGGFESVIKGYGIQVVHPHQLELYNNSVYYDGDGKESSALWVDVSREPFFIKNNIFANYGEGYAVNIERIGNDTLTTYESDFNNYFTNGEVIASYDFKEYPTLEDYQTRAGKDANSINFDPQYRSKLDLHIANPNLDKKGTSLTNVTLDYDGDARDGATPDIGADEFTLTEIDLGISQFLTQSLSPENSNISIELINEGLGSLVGEEIELQFSFDNGENYSDPESFTIATLEGTGDRESFEFTNTLPVEKSFGEMPVCVRIVSGSLAEDLNASNDSLCANICIGFKGTYTVGPAIISDFTTITEAALALKSCGLAGDVTLQLEKGTFNEQVELYNIPNLSAQATLTIQGDPTNPDQTKVTFQSPRLMDNHHVIKLNGTNHVNINGITVQNTSIDTASAIFITQNSSNVTINNCKIIMAEIDSADILIGVSGSHNEFLNFNGKSGNNNKITNSTFIGGTHSISIFGELPTKMSSGYEVIGNRMLNFTKVGVFGTDVNFKNIANNEIAGKPESPSSFGIIINESDSAITINANKIAGVSKSGITLIAQNRALQGENLISNNMILGNESNEGSGEPYSGIEIISTSKTKILHNTVVLQTLNNNEESSALKSLESDSLWVYNNILNNLGDGLCLSIDTASKLIGSDNNVLSSNGRNFAFVEQNYAEFSEFTSGTSTNGNSMDYNPEFNSLSDLHTTDSKINDIGNPAFSVTNDYDNQKRSNTPDPGADEFTADLDLIASNFDIFDLAGKKASNEIKSGLYIAEFTVIQIEKKQINDSIFIAYQVNGEPKFSKSYFIPVEFSESKFSGARLILDQPGQIEICATLSLSGDIDPSNDQFCKTYTVTDSTVNGVTNRRYEIKVWPNPANSTINISHTFGSEMNYEIYSTDMRLLRSWKKQPASTTLDIQSLPKGIYFLRSTDNFGANYLKRIIKN